MFYTYLRRELRRRARQTIAVALGLALGISLVIGASSASAGIKDAQTKVLKSLYGVGTDITVSKSAAAGSGRPQTFGARGSGDNKQTRISRDSLRAGPGTATLKASTIATVKSVSGVKDAVGVLSLTDTDFSGSITTKDGSSGATSSSSQTPPAGSSSQQPPSFNGSFNLKSFTVDGVSVTSSTLGPINASQVTAGRYFTADENNARVAIVNSSYATQHKLTVGSTLTVAGKRLTVIGITTSSSANVYIPLGTAQTLADMKGDITSVDVSATSSSVVATTAKAIRAALPTTTVTAAASLAAQISGSLSSASSLVSKLGKGISIGGLVMAILIAGLMMSSAVARRVREFGTLKAMGWRTRRVVAQVIGEGAVIGVVGAVIGVGLGVGIAAVITGLSPALSATVGASSAATAIGGAAGAFGGAASKVLVHLTAPLQMTAIVAAIGLALAGGLIAGGVGAFRAAKLRPAAALRRLE